MTTILRIVFTRGSTSQATNVLYVIEPELQPPPLTLNLFAFFQRCWGEGMMGSRLAPQPWLPSRQRHSCCLRSDPPPLFHEQWGLLYEQWGRLYEHWGLLYGQWGLLYEQWGLLHEQWGLMYEQWRVLISSRKG